jgi:protein-disulfide isomerase-like protein with CxxC motif
MSIKKISYIMDPHCIGSFASLRVIQDLIDHLIGNYEFEILPGGMWINKNSRRGGRAIKDFLLPSIIRSNEFSNAGISKAYIDLIEDPSYLLNSTLPSQGIMAIKTLYPEKSIDFAHQLMKQQFVYGRRYDIEKTYINALNDLNLDISSFRKYWRTKENVENTIEVFERAKLLSSSFQALILHHETGNKVIKSAGVGVNELITELADNSFEVL